MSYQPKHGLARAARRLGWRARAAVAGGAVLALAVPGFALASGAGASTSGCLDLGPSCGTNVNAFGNAWDVAGQKAVLDNKVISYPNGSTDPATDLVRTGTATAGFRYEYAPNGVKSGLCPADPDGGYAADPGGPDGIVLRTCNTGNWQLFRPDAGGHLVNVATHKPVQTNGTGRQLTGGGSYTGGSVWTWKGGTLTLPPPPPPVTSWTATTKIANDPDSAVGGSYWASDQVTRTVTINRGNQAATSDCVGAPAGTACYWYSGHVSDTSTFTTLSGAVDPDSGNTPITGIVSGSISGSGDFSFYASGTPDASLVAPNLNDGCTPATTPVDCKTAAGNVPAKDGVGFWVEQFFPNGSFFGPDLQPSAGGALRDDWSWTYTTTSSCVSPVQTWVNAAAGNTGDITGQSGCPTG
jgi:hypothetical protein